MVWKSNSTYAHKSLLKSDIDLNISLTEFEKEHLVPAPLEENLF